MRLPPSTSGGQQTNPRFVVGDFERCLSKFRLTWKRRTPGWRSRCKPLMSKTASHKDDYVALMCSFRVPGAAADRDRKVGNGAVLRRSCGSGLFSEKRSLQFRKTGHYPTVLTTLQPIQETINE